MSKRIMRLKLILLDADVIIEAYRIGIWLDLIGRVQIAVPSIVAHDEALFYSEEEGRIPQQINLPKLIQKGEICELMASDIEMGDLYSKFDRVFVEGLHDGEAEAIALIYAQKAEGYKFCTGDKVAIQSLAMIGYSSEGISMEKLLSNVGLQKNLSHQFTESYFKKWLGIGKKRLITGNGLSKSST